MVDSNHRLSCKEIKDRRSTSWANEPCTQFDFKYLHVSLNRTKKMIKILSENKSNRRADEFTLTSNIYIESELQHLWPNTLILFTWKFQIENKEPFFCALCAASAQYNYERSEHLFLKNSVYWSSPEPNICEIILQKNQKSLLRIMGINSKI